MFHKTISPARSGQFLLRTLIDSGQTNPVVEKISPTMFLNNAFAAALQRKMGFETKGRCVEDPKLAPEIYPNEILTARPVK